jgi:hypothetical protein
MVEQARRRQRWWLISGGALAASATLGVLAYPFLYRALASHDVLLFSLACTLAVLLGLGTLVVLFNLGKPRT